MYGRIHKVTIGTDMNVQNGYLNLHTVAERTGENPTFDTLNLHKDKYKELEDLEQVSLRNCENDGKVTLERPFSKISMW